nr:hypothetical protein CFP56_36440 [Quercus suber]
MERPRRRSNAKSTPRLLEPQASGVSTTFAIVAGDVVSTEGSRQRHCRRLRRCGSMARTAAPKDWMNELRGKSKSAGLLGLLGKRPCRRAWSVGGGGMSSTYNVHSNAVTAETRDHYDKIKSPWKHAVSTTGNEPHIPVSRHSQWFFRSIPTCSPSARSSRFSMPSTTALVCQGRALHPSDQF